MNLRPILYAEDEEADVFFMRRALERAAIPNPLVVLLDGQRVIEYLDGCITPARGQQKNPLPSLVLLDLNLPVRSGLEVLEWIRAHPAVNHVPVVVVTSSTQEIDVHRAYAHGANGYLVKPGKPIHLLPLVNSIKAYWLAENHVPEGFVLFSGDQFPPAVFSSSDVAAFS